MSLWTEVIALLMKTAAVVVLTFITYLFGSSLLFLPVLPVAVIALTFGALWLMSLWRLIWDFIDFQRFTVIDATAEGLAWSRRRGQRGPEYLIPRSAIRDVGLEMKPLGISRRSKVSLLVKLRDDGEAIPHEATHVWLYNGDLSEGFAVVNRLRDALDIRAA